MLVSSNFLFICSDFCHIWSGQPHYGRTSSNIIIELINILKDNKRETEEVFAGLRLLEQRTSYQFAYAV